MKKQTAVEWLCSQIYTIQVEIEAGNTHLKNKIEQAKEMEKQQIIDANIEGMEFVPVDPSRYQEDAEQYYTETFNN
jgi:hypothetical protein